MKHNNMFLESLSRESRSSLVRLCAEVDLPLRKSLYEPGIVPMYAYFMTSGIASVVSAKADGRWDTAYAGQATIAVPRDLASALVSRF